LTSPRGNRGPVQRKIGQPRPPGEKKAEVLYLKSPGFPHTDIQDIARATRTTLASYLKSYLEGRMAWVLANNHHGRAGELDGHAEMMKKYFAENPPVSSREAVAKAGELTGLSRSPTQVRTFMGVIENLSRYKKVLDTLITPNFQDFSNVNIRTV
jgi:hypothetical protein